MINWYTQNYYVEEKELVDPDTLFLKAKSSIQKLIDLYSIYCPERRYDLTTLSSMYSKLDHLTKRLDLGGILCATAKPVTS